MNYFENRNRQNEFEEEFEMHEQYGGVKKSKSKYQRTSGKYTDKCGKERTLYDKNGVKYIRKKSAKTGKFGYYKVKAA